MRQLCKGNVAVIKGAVLAGCRAYYGYPITPASEVAEAAALYFPEVGGTFVQAESETASINMVYGAASAGQRVMTASSGPGLSLMQEGISYLAGAELPCVIVDVMRGGPGLGNIAVLSPPDLLIAMNEISLRKFASQIAPGGAVAILTDRLIGVAARWAVPLGS